MNNSIPVVFCCDVQDKFAKAILHFDTIIQSVVRLIEGTKLLNVPLIVTEQYPKGLGSTVKDINIEHALGVFPKTKFSMVIPEVCKKLDELKSGQQKKLLIILCGIESHVCIQQTALDLLALGHQVMIPADAVSSRTQHDRIVSLRRLEKAGAIITTVESVLFQLLGDCTAPQFKAIQALIRNTLPDTGLAAAL